MSSTLNPPQINNNPESSYDNPVFIDPDTDQPNATALSKGIEEPEKNGPKPDFIDRITAKIITFFTGLGSIWLKSACLVLYVAYFVIAVDKTWNQTTSYCHGVKLMAVLNALAVAILVYKHLLKPFVLMRAVSSLERQQVLSRRCFARLAWTFLLTVVLVYLIWIGWAQVERFKSVAGYIVILAIAFLFSKHRHAVKWNQILWGLSMQFGLALLVLRTELGETIFTCIGDKVNSMLDCARSGSTLIFGYLATGQLNGPVWTHDGVNTTLPMAPQAAIFAFTAMPVIIFFSFVVKILYFYGAMQIIVQQLGWLLQVTIGTTACESISAAGNIFLGMTESPLLVKPFLGIMTKSELHAVLTAGFATVAGSTMAAYISFGISAKHLLSGSVMAAPCALAMSKLVYPETEASRTTAQDVHIESSEERNVIEAACNGASSSIKLVANIVANLIAFISFLALLDLLLEWLGQMVGVAGLSFRLILSKLFIPLALAMGVEWADCEHVASLIGMKMVANEFVAYQELSLLIKEGVISARSQTIVTYALCGFANFGSMGISIGGLSSMAPNRKSDLARMVLRAMFTGAAVSFLTACIAGMLI